MLMNKKLLSISATPWVHMALDLNDCNFLKGGLLQTVSGCSMFTNRILEVRSIDHKERMWSSLQITVWLGINSELWMKIWQGISQGDNFIFAKWDYNGKEFHYEDDNPNNHLAPKVNFIYRFPNCCIYH